MKTIRRYAFSARIEAVHPMPDDRNRIYADGGFGGGDGWPVEQCWPFRDNRMSSRTCRHANCERARAPWPPRGFRTLNYCTSFKRMEYAKPMCGHNGRHRRHTTKTLLSLFVARAKWPDLLCMGRIYLYKEQHGCCVCFVLVGEKSHDDDAARRPRATLTQHSARSCFQTVDDTSATRGCCCLMMTRLLTMM